MCSISNAFDFVRSETGTTVILIIVACSSFLFLKRRWTYNKNTKNYPPGPTSWPVFGNAPQLGPECHKIMTKWAEIYGPVFKIKLGSTPVVVLNSYNSIREALVTKRSVFSGRPNFDSFKAVSHGRGVVFNDHLTQPGQWNDHKKLLSRTIHEFALAKDTRQEMLCHLHKEIDFLVDTLSDMCDNNNGFADPEDLIRLSISNAICALCFGKRYPINDKTFMELLRHNEEFGKVAATGSMIDVMPWLQIIPYFRNVVKTFWELNERISNWTFARVSEHLKTFEIHKIRDLLDVMVNNTIEGTSKVLLKKEYKNISTEKMKTHSNFKQGQLSDIIDQELLSALTVDIFGAAKDTLCGSMIYVFHYMIKYPRVQDNIQEELDRVTGNELPTIEHKSKLVYLEASFHEIMRHSSFLAMTIPHMTTDDSTIEGYDIDKNTVVFINQYAVNQDKTFWEDPHLFKPERFIQTNKNGSYELNKDKLNRYLIFSLGQRKCPGKDLSALWIIMAMAILLKQCKLYPNPHKPPTDEVITGLSSKPKYLSIKLTKVL